MRRVLFSLLACASLGLSAQAPESPRLAFFSMGQLIETSVKARRIYSELEATKKQLEEKIQAKGAEGQKLQAQLQSSSLSDAGKEQIQKQLRDLEFEFKKLQEDSQGEFNKVSQKVQKALNELAAPVVRQLAAEQKLQVVFTLESSPVAWADEVWIKQFTAEVAKRLDAGEDKAAAPAAKPAAKPAAAGPKKN